MSDSDKPSKTGIPHPSVVAGNSDPADPIVVNAHTGVSDYPLQPDPIGTRDPIGSAGFNQDSSASKAAEVVDTVKQKASVAADRAAELARQAGGHAADLADDVRERLGSAADTVRGHASDASDRASDAYDGARTWATGVHRDNMRRIDDAVVRGSEGLERSRTTVEQFVTENPLLVGVVGVAAGLLLGALIPRTRQEDRSIGPYADEVRDQGLRYAREFTNRGREFVETALDPDNLNAAAEKVAAKTETARPATERAAHRL